MIHFDTFIEASYMVCSTPPDTDATSFVHLSYLGSKERKNPQQCRLAFRKQMQKKSELMRGMNTCKMSWMVLSWVMDLMNGRITSRLLSDKRLATKSMGIAYATMIKKVGIWIKSFRNQCSHSDICRLRHTIALGSGAGVTLHSGTWNVCTTCTNQSINPSTNVKSNTHKP